MRINDPQDPMPPIDSHKQLSPDEIEILGRWIDQGAVYAAHWSYAPVTPTKVPTIESAYWSRGDIDQFLLAAMHRQGLAPAPTETPARLLRRLYLDLIGLPPTIEELAAFADDPSEQAYAETVDRLLADSRFGEHWASWWLDLVRYGDSVGYHGDQPWSVWPYRDWVIRAFNENMPFDRFSRMQLAGDLMAEAGETTQQRNDRLFASAYNRLAPVTAEGGAQAKEYRAIYAADRVTNFGEVWLASTTGCAQCHDHKYDPFTAADFYSLAAVFADIDHADVYNGGANPHWSPFRFTPTDDSELTKQVEDIQDRYERLLAEHPKAGAYETWAMARSRGPMPPVGTWRKELDQLIKERNELAKRTTYGLVTRSLSSPRVTRLLPRGNWMDDGGPLMQPRPPEFLGDEVKNDNGFNRLDLANWLFSNNPLTARVLVNRLWERFFGRGISSNSLDVGNQGEPPSHPALINWLAAELPRAGWDLKHMMRLMVMSNAYRQSSEQSREQLKLDPDNQWFARQSAPRLPAEVLRDQLLAVSGLLSQKTGGPSVNPYQPKGHWSALNFPRRTYQQSHGEDLYRRSVYCWMQRTFPHPAMTTFDAPNRESCTAHRSESNTPLQALTLLNEMLYVEGARNLAQRSILLETSDELRIRNMFYRVLLRDPTPVELERLLALLNSQSEYFSNSPEAADRLCQIGESAADASLSLVEIASYTSVARVLLNLHETVTKP